MKRKPGWRFLITLILIGASVITYVIHYLIFHDIHHIFLYMIGDIAFLFLDVLLVILIIERLLSQREKRSMMKKLNMVIGTFFSEVGLPLLGKFASFVDNAKDLSRQLVIKPAWSNGEFSEAVKAARKFAYQITIDKPGLKELQTFLSGKRDFLLLLLDNPNLLEHERFTDLLWAVFHLAEELAYRGDKLDSLPPADYNHLAGDLKRAYSQIVSEWITYAQHLKEKYPFLFSLAARINPFSPNPSAILS